MINGAALLQAIAPQLAQKTGEWIAPLSAIATRLPPTSGNLIECHMDQNGPWLDFACRVNHAFDRPLIPELGTWLTGPERDSPHFQALLDPKTGFRYGIENLWLEYDAPFQALPSLFADFSPETPAGAIETMWKIPMNPLILKEIHEQTGIAYYGILPGRPAHRRVRICTRPVPAHHLMEALPIIGWEGDLTPFRGVQSACMQADTPVILDVDLGSTLGPTLGIEVREEVLAAMLHHPKYNTLISKAMQQFIAAWPGTTRLPESLAEALSALHQRPVKKLHRRINHLKFTLLDGKMKVKVYLYYCF